MRQFIIESVFRSNTLTWEKDAVICSEHREISISFVNKELVTMCSTAPLYVTNPSNAAPKIISKPHSKGYYVIVRLGLTYSDEKEAFEKSRKVMQALITMLSWGISNDFFAEHLSTTLCELDNQQVKYVYLEHQPTICRGQGNISTFNGLDNLLNGFLKKISISDPKLMSAFDHLYPTLGINHIVLDSKVSLFLVHSAFEQVVNLIYGELRKSGLISDLQQEEFSKFNTLIQQKDWDKTDRESIMNYLNKFKNKLGPSLRDKAAHILKSLHSPDIEQMSIKIKEGLKVRNDLFHGSDQSDSGKIETISEEMKHVISHMLGLYCGFTSGYSYKNIRSIQFRMRQELNLIAKPEQ